MNQDGVQLEVVFTVMQKNLAGAINTLDRFDADLAREGKWVFVTYDELDRVSSSDWEQLTTILRGLIQFWSSHSRRWRHLRPKIFLRRDLYERAAIVGPDVSKISAQRLELTWTPRDLYALLAKRF
jgi:DNA phosphorothioation-dependent restriction protein DptG